MTVFCTYCSAKKSSEPGEIPAIQRYISCRIKKVYAASRLVGLPFRVLSGEYGLVSSELPIPDYNHLLTPEKAPALAQVVARQIRAEEITGFVYFTKPLSTNPKVLPYQEALAIACREMSISLCVVELENKSMRLRNDVMEMANKAKLAMISDRTIGEREFSALLAQNPNDGMIYFNRGEAYEALGERALAKTDFQRAMAMFPQSKWKARAQEGIDRAGG
jgi:tetratricopeptide (TPR) repeat protein